MGTVLAAAGGGVGWGQRVSARGAAQRAQTAKKADFSFARCARGHFFFARCARALSFSRICRICVEDTAGVLRKASSEILILEPS